GQSAEEWALGHLYFGLQKSENGWTLREWAPNATALYLLCDTNDWRDDAAFAFTRGENGVWELQLSASTLTHGDHYKLNVHWGGGSGERIPAYARYVKQEPQPLVFDAVVWQPDTPYQWKKAAPPRPDVALIYE